MLIHGQEINNRNISKVFMNKRNEFKNQIDILRENENGSKIIAKIGSFEFLFELASKNNNSIYNNLKNDSNLKKFEAINILIEEDKDNIIDESGKRVLINIFSSVLKDFFIKESNLNNVVLTVILLLKIYEFFPKDTEFIKINIPNIINHLSDKGYIILDNESKFIIQNSIDSNFVKDIFLDIIKNLLKSDSRNEKYKIESIKLILKNEDIFNLIKEELLEIIRYLLKKDFEDEYCRNNLIELIIKNENFFKLKEELPETINHLLNKDSEYGGHKNDLIKLIINNEKFFNLMKEELSKTINHLLNNGFKDEDDKNNLIELIIKNENIFNLMKEELLKIIKYLLKKGFEYNSSKNRLIKLIIKNENIFNLMKEELPKTINYLLNNDFESGFSKKYLIKLIIKNENIFNLMDKESLNKIEENQLKINKTESNKIDKKNNLE